ncbi:hypothetical protein AYK26_00550 [Euryarchaeota archaeon SM23-78]|nr:MAG: hypothetical protein AYK26_00550 [Euryarchaeota archaeon SM23-78]MBW3001395.1 hypothetical protein [Candidatus Woesearchaeota archaeon]
MVESLEERLKNIDKHSLKEALLTPLILPREAMRRVGYYKYNITDNLQRYLYNRGVRLQEKPKYSVGENIYSIIRKEPLKRVQYGMINSDKIGDDVFKALTDWEATYFLAGVWNKKSTLSEEYRYNREVLERQPVELIVAETIATGVYRLRKIHEKQTRAGKYKTQAELPYSKEILRRYYDLRNKLRNQNNQKQKESKQLKLF